MRSRRRHSASRPPASLMPPTDTGPQ
jgi:hypothetical protein